MFPHRWLFVLPFGFVLTFGGCARYASTGVRMVDASQFSRAEGKAVFDALHVHCWQIDLPAVTGGQYVVVKLDLRQDGKAGVGEAPRFRGNERQVILALVEDGPNQAWSFVTTTGNSGFRPSESQPLGAAPNIASVFFDPGVPQKDGSVRLARWDYRDADGKLSKTIEAVVTVGKRIGEGLGQPVRD